MKIAVCIPTYNRGNYIGDLLDSIVRQDLDNNLFEVVISDNASTDHTTEVVESYKGKIKNLRYFKWDSNKGADRNYLKVVELATAEYCWLMGSDDVIEPHSLQFIYRLLDTRKSIGGISVNRIGYMPDMVNILNERPVGGGISGGDIVEFSSPEQTFQALGEYFGYLSGQIVNRAYWNNVVTRLNLEPYYNAYVHVFVIGNMLKLNSTWLYINKKLVGWRSGNDSFMSEGRLKRVLIDIKGYDQITRDIFGRGSETWQKLNSVVATVHVKYALIDAKLNNANWTFFKTTFYESVKRYWALPQFWSKTFPVFIVPGVGFRVARSIYRTFIKPYRFKTPVVGGGSNCSK